MAKRHKYLEQPVASPNMPGGIPYIVANEAAERFSYYGMRTILMVFMTEYLLTRNGTPDPMSNTEAMFYLHSFMSAVYIFPVLGAIAADALLGKYRTILSLSIVYCLGHLALALDDTRIGLLCGLTLIAVGSGGIKPCVSAHVGDQFGPTNQHLISKVFGWFYFAINFGSIFSTLLTPLLLQKYGPHVAFGVPGILMAVATLFFWMGRNKFVHIPPGGWNFIRETFSAEGLRTMMKLLSIYIFVAIFWALYDQSASAWILQAKHMDLHVMGTELLPSQVHAVNPALILIYIPLFSYIIYPTINRFFPLNPLRKLTIGFFLAALAFVVSAWIEQMITAGLKPGIEWQLLAYAILTAAEVMVSITCLEFAYTQAPPTMKSIVMAINFLSVAMGNAFTATVNRLILNSDGTSKISNTNYYWLFVYTMAGAAILFIFVARQYREKTYLQQEQPETVK